MSRKIFYIAMAIGIAMLLPTFAQKKQPATSIIEAEMEQGHYATADSLLQKVVTEFIRQKNWDTLLHFIPLAGKITYKQNGAEKAALRVLSFIENLQTKNDNPKYLLEAYRSAAEFFNSVAQVYKASEASDKALNYAYLAPGKDSLEVAKSLYNLGVYAHKLGNIEYSRQLHRRSLQIRQGPLLLHPPTFTFPTMPWVLSIGILQNMIALPPCSQVL